MDDKLNMPQIKNIIATNIRKRDIPVHQLAQISGVSTFEIYEIINGQLLPSLGTLRKLSEALNIPLTDLIN
ncbi:MAG: helix-turn-helix transcriptional regulator [Clostridia bacterium]|nr:helix-turn-helix transcriptional regulator [Clostridia bacterium]MDE6869186.1 helix-turn-helix transcriptional regulator [Clostridia bacterium]